MYGRHLVRGVLAAACTLWVIDGARADLITFDIDGAGGANSPMVVGALDMAPGNTLFTFPSSSTYQFSHHAALAGLVNANGNPVAPLGLNSTFEITIVSSVLFESVVDEFNVTVVVAPVQPVNSFIEIWYDTTPDADSLAGTGYNDGTRIYFGSPRGALGSLASQAVHDGPDVPYDQFGVDNYPGQTTSISTGSYFFGSTTNVLDSSFFVTPVASVELTTGIDTPFDMTNPSAKYVSAAGGAAPVPGSFIVGLPFQADGALQFTVPEPSSLAVLGLGFAALARRSRRATA